jgi:hypothetical protein
MLETYSYWYMGADHLLSPWRGRCRKEPSIGSAFVRVLLEEFLRQLSQVASIAALHSCIFAYTSEPVKPFEVKHMKKKKGGKI